MKLLKRLFWIVLILVFLFVVFYYNIKIKGGTAALGQKYAPNISGAWAKNSDMQLQASTLMERARWNRFFETGQWTEPSTEDLVVEATSLDIEAIKDTCKQYAKASCKDRPALFGGRNKCKNQTYKECWNAKMNL
jgi:hypothetical protein